MKKELIERIGGGLIVSCQALENEPLHSSFIMSKMALAAKIGGAAGIRANTAADIRAIKSEVDLPIIGIIKREYGDNPVYITPTMKEVDELCQEGVEIIALDATVRIRPDGRTLKELVKDIKKKYPSQLLMADTSNYEEAVAAAELGFDFIGTTLCGYTEYTRHLKIEENDFELIRKIIGSINVPVIAEGNIDTPEKARRCIELGAVAVVTGGAITRPQLITKKFADEVKCAGGVDC